MLSALLVAIQLERFDAHKRKIALSSIAIFFAGATAIWYLEEIRALLWEDPPIAQLARGAAREAVDEAMSEAREGSGNRGGNPLLRRKDASAPTHVSRNRFQECADCPEMVIIPGGHLPAGQNAAPIQSFALGRFELTIQEFHAFVVKTGFVPSRQCEGTAGRAAVAVAQAYRQNGLANSGGRPVACISWNDAKAYLG